MTIILSKIVDQKEYVMTWNQEGNALIVNELFYWKILTNKRSGQYNKYCIRCLDYSKKYREENNVFMERKSQRYVEV